MASHQTCIPQGYLSRNSQAGAITYVNLGEASFRIHELGDKTFRVEKKGRMGWLGLEYQWNFTDRKDDWEPMSVHKGFAFRTFEGALDYLRNPDRGYHNARKSERVVNTTEFHRV